MVARKCIAVTFIIAILVMAGSSLYAGNLLVEEFPDYEGWINWEHQVVKAIGRGVLPGDMEQPEQARVIARDQSMVIARRNLALTVGSLRVDADTRVSDLTASSDVIKDKVDKLIRSAKLVSIKQIYDCSFEAILQVNIPGDNGLIAAVLPDINMVHNTRYEAEPERGIIIDVPDTYQPVLFPRIFDDKGHLIFSVSTCRPDHVVRYGIVRYYSGKKIKTDKKTGKSIVVKADKSSSGSDIVLNHVDTAKLLKSNDQLAKYGIALLVSDW